MSSMLTVYDNNPTPIVVGHVKASEIIALALMGAGSQWSVRADLIHATSLPMSTVAPLTPLLATPALAQAQLDKFVALMGNLDVSAL